jgi:predicted adenine nucleotide alpha hydrolase (AANH) superfamily ATPase
MNLLLHICCAPCAIYPVGVLRQENHDITGFFFNNNIHPYQEYQRRADALSRYSRQIDLKVVFSQTYDLEGFLRAVAFREAERCRICYYDRLKATARMAKTSGFDAFTSTLLYSKFQKHDLIQATGEAIGKEFGVPFLYKDFREGWKAGVDESRKMNMYRQPYCGCIYSEKERYCRSGGRQSDL